MQMRNTSGRQRATPATVPSPVKGLNGRDGLANMDPLYAFTLTNIFPNSTTCDTRRGSATHATGVPGAVESLEVFAGGSSSKLLAFGGGGVYNVSAAGAVGAALQSGRTSNKVTTIMFSNAGSQFLLGVSGADAPFSYDGTTFANLTITGLTGSQTTLHNIFAFKGRVFLAQRDQLGFYFLAVGAIQGAASYFDLSQVARKGGYLIGMASFSQDSGVGPQDYCVFMTSEGEYLVYNGTDPSNAATWALIGRYYAAPPIGRKGWFNFGEDLYVVTEEGILPFSLIRQRGDVGESREVLTSSLGKYYTDTTVNYATFGWQAVLYPRGKMLIVNVPNGAAPSDGYSQFVMNTETKAWCLFSGWSGQSWAVHDKRLYFGTSDGTVVLADEGTTDNGAQINCEARQAYNYFDDGRGAGAADKHFHYVVFVVQADGTPPISAEVNVNFEQDAPDYSGSLAPSSGAAWDTGTWDADGWGGDATAQTFSVPVGKLGFTASVWLRTVATGEPLKWYATRMIFERSKGLLVM